MRIMAVDYGRKRVGVAVTDPQCTISQPLTTLKVTSRQQVVKRLSALIQELDIGQVIIGYPCTMNGQPTEMAHEIERFVKLLKKKVNIEIEFWDERLTSKYAHTTLKTMGIGHHRDTVDQVAACIMLDEYLKLNRCQVS